MKIRNYLYATMIACAFASCSNDDEVIGGGTETQGDATLDIKIALPALTKATAADGMTDQTISSLNLYVFEGDALVGSSADNGKAGDASRLIKGLKPGDKKVLILANSSATSASLAAILAETVSIDSEMDGTLSMNSKVYDVTLEAGKTNYLGYSSTDAADGKDLGLTNGNPVNLFRNVAKVVLNKVAFTPESRYTNASFTIDSVFILHGAATSLKATAAEWGATSTSADYKNGVVNNNYSAWVNYMNALTAPTIKQQYLATTNYSLYNNYGSAQELSVESTVNKVDSFYVYENSTSAQNIETLLVIQGTMTYGSNPVTTVSRRYYSVAIGKDGYTPADQTLNGVARSISRVVRNMQYNVDLTVKGPGWDTPFGPDATDNTALDVKVTVVPFGQVSQNVEIE